MREFAIEVAERGALVLYGACDAVVHPPYGPFVEAFEHLEAQAAVSRRPGERVASDPDTERHRLHTGVAGLLERLARERPVLLVIEDAHWADAPSLGCCVTSRGRPAGCACSCSPPSGTPRRRLPDALAERSRTSVAPTTSCGCGSAGFDETR